jgi:hypothetical protein
MSSSTSSQEKNNRKWKVMGCSVSEEEFQNIIAPNARDCYQLGLIPHETVSYFVRFCVNFWIGHYCVKKQQFEMREQQEIEDEKSKLAAIVAQKEQAYEKSTAHVIQKATKQIEELGEELDRGFEETHPSSSRRPRRKQQSAASKTTANLSLEDMMT